jgi:hypothetical protein
MNTFMKRRPFFLHAVLVFLLGTGCTSRTSLPTEADEEPVLASEPQARPGSELDARRILNRAVEAQGGDIAMLKLDTGRATWTMHQILRDHGEDDVTIEETFDLPDRIKRVIRGKSAGKPTDVAWVIDGDKCWYKEGGQKTRELPSPPAADSEPGPLRLLRSLRDAPRQDLRVALVEEVQAGGQTLQGVELTSGNEPAEHAYFDKATGLIARYRSKRRVPSTAPKASVMETKFSDFAEFGRIKIPTKLVTFQDNKKVLEIRVLKVEFMSEIDDDVFAPP